MPPEVMRMFETLDLPVSSPIPAMTIAYQDKQVGLICRRLFAYRQQQPWPSNVAYGPDWETLYAEAASGTEVLLSVEEAVLWGNALIGKLYGCRR